jgi:hypothetical protein
MKRSLMFLLCAVLLCFSCAAFAQDEQQLPDVSTLPTFNPSNDEPSDGSNVISAGVVVTAKNASATGVGVPMWSYQVTSPVNGITYSGVMIGRSPLVRGARTTNITVHVIPIKTQTIQGFVMDPTALDAGCIGAGNTAMGLTLAGPNFQNHNWVFGPTAVGNTQYSDATQRANFWSTVGTTNGGFHTILSPVIAEPLQSFVAATGAQGTAYGAGTCGAITTGAVNRKGVLNVLNINNVDPFLEQTLVNLHIPATDFAFFVFYNTVMTGGTAASPLTNCCILGYHSDNDDTSPNLITTYGLAEFDRGGIFSGTQDTSVMAHEIQEWMDDPLGNNLVPAWGHIGQQSGCQNNLEEGDPLSGTLIPPVLMPNGFTYHLQDLGPYFSWFFRTPSLGVNGWYDNIHALATDAGPVCH